MSSSSSADRRFARETGAAREIADLAEPALEELGFRLVRVKVSGRTRRTCSHQVGSENTTTGFGPNRNKYADPYLAAQRSSVR